VYRAFSLGFFDGVVTKLLQRAVAAKGLWQSFIRSASGGRKANAPHY
jgi:hypothetical protein